MDGEIFKIITFYHFDSEPDFPHVYYMLGANLFFFFFLLFNVPVNNFSNLVSLLYRDVTVVQTQTSLLSFRSLLKANDMTNMSCIRRKPVFGVIDQVQHKPGCAATGERQRLEILNLECGGIVLHVPV